MIFNKDKFSKMMKEHFNWIVEMNYHKTSFLEKTILVYSEIGEASNELRGNTIREGFGEELSDILLRMMAIVSQLNLEDLFLNFTMESIEYYSTRELINTEISELEKIRYIIKPMNSAFAIVDEDYNLENSSNRLDFIYNLSNIFTAVYIIASKKEINISEIIKFKINKNINNGNKGRLK